MNIPRLALLFLVHASIGYVVGGCTAVGREDSPTRLANGSAAGSGSDESPATPLDAAQAAGVSGAGDSSSGDETDEVLARARATFAEARAAKERGDHAAAREEASEAIEGLLAMDGREDSAARIAMLFELGTFAHGAGALKAAEKAGRRVLEVRSAVLAKEDLRLTAAQGNLALTIKALGDIQAARVLQEQVLESRLRTLPMEHAELQRARRNLASTLFELGEFSGARAQFEQALEVCLRTRPEDHPELQSVRGNLAATLHELGEFADARVLEEKVLEVRSRTLPADHPELQLARQNLARTLRNLGELDGAYALELNVLEVRLAALPEHHPDLQYARANLSVTLHALGDFRGARALQEQVLEVRSRTLPGDHPELQAARQGLAVILYSLGDFNRAQALFEQVLEVRQEALPEEHPDLLAARQGLAVALRSLGDLHGARVLQSRVLEVRSRTLPGDHPDLAGARGNLAITIRALGDHAGARALQEQVLEVLSRTLPEDHPDLAGARTNLASTIKQSGDLARARALEEAVLEVLSRTVHEDHPDLAGARANFALTLRAQGDHAAARALQEAVLAVRLRTLPEDHTDVQAARGNLARTIKALGEFEGARALEEQVLEDSSRTLPEDHPDLQTARGNLATTIAAESARAAGEEWEREEARDRGRARCEALISDLLLAKTRAARSVLLSAPSREAEERCARFSPKLDLGISFARGYGVFERSPALESASFELCEATRGAALSAAALARRAAGDARYAERRAELVRASEELASLVRREGVSSEDFHRARVPREAAESGLLALAREVAGGKLGGVDLSVKALTGALREKEVAVAFRRFEDGRVEVQSATESGASPIVREVSTDRLCAFVVRGTGSHASERANTDVRTTADASSSELLTLVDLGPIAPIEEAVREWREAIGMAQGRGVPVGKTHAAGDLHARGDALRRSVFDPLLAAAEESRRIIVVLDDVLHLVAFDALPMDASGSRLVGDGWTIETRATLTELLDPPLEAPRGGAFLGLGGVSYDGVKSELLAGAIASGSNVESREIEVAGILRGGAWSGGFTALPATREEVAGIERSFADAHGADAERSWLAGSQATKERLLELAPGACFLHIATHGWFASESIRSWSDPTPIDEKLGIGTRLTGEEQVRGMSPMLLCGLALAGANLPEDAVGRAPGLITAQEIAVLDLSNCELAVLSACDTNVGERRAGQGVASLQKALHMAGARTVITSLWKVPDEATKDLMLDFYRRMWVEKQPKAQALWEAKKKLRDAKDERGQPRYTTRDWAAWVLTGEPD